MEKIVNHHHHFCEQESQRPCQHPNFEALEHHLLDELGQQDLHCLGPHVDVLVHQKLAWELRFLGLQGEEETQGA